MAYYKIIREHNAADLVGEVQKSLDAGWVLVGDLVVVRERSNAPTLLYIREMAKYTTNTAFAEQFKRAMEAGAFDEPRYD